MQIFLADERDGTNGPTEGSTRGPRGPKKGNPPLPSAAPLPSPLSLFASLQDQDVRIFRLSLLALPDRSIGDQL